MQTHDKQAFVVFLRPDDSTVRSSDLTKQPETHTLTNVTDEQPQEPRITIRSNTESPVPMEASS